MTKNIYISINIKYFSFNKYVCETYILADVE